jgi:hypothetical protein
LEKTTHPTNRKQGNAQKIFSLVVGEQKVEIGKRLTAKTARPPKEKRIGQCITYELQRPMKNQRQYVTVKSPASYVLNNVYSITSLLGTSDLVRWFL